MTGRLLRQFVSAIASVAGATVIATVMVASATEAAQQEIPATWIDVGAMSVTLDNMIDEARRATSGDDFWLGYTFALRDGVHIGCEDARGKSISFGSDGTRFYLDADEPGALPCDSDVGLFLRVDGDEEGVVDVRLLSLGRAATRLQGTVVWAGEFAADESAAWLRAAVLDDGPDGLRVVGGRQDRARRRLLSAVAVHDSRDAVGTILEALNAFYPRDLRESAVFWVAQFGGQEGLTELLVLARGDDDSEIRKQSIFWLAQAAGERATEDLAAIAAGDPETEVQKSAVFALSQIDDDDAIDELVEIVRTHGNSEVVKSALFWLGQSGDARAVELIEEILFGRRL